MESNGVEYEEISLAAESEKVKKFLVNCLSTDSGSPQIPNVYIKREDYIAQDHIGGVQALKAYLFGQYSNPQCQVHIDSEDSSDNSTEETSSDAEDTERR